jgi:hypothetical protein
MGFAPPLACSGVSQELDVEASTGGRFDTQTPAFVSCWRVSPAGTVDSENPFVL